MKGTNAGTGRTVLGGLRARLRGLRNRRRIVRSGLFDAAWYRMAYVGRDIGGDPLGHYMTIGAAEGLKPNPLFDGRWYLNRYPDVGREGQNPLLHYIVSGAAEGRDPNPYFASAWYRAAYLDATSAANPLAHYLSIGAAQGHRPSPRFDAAWYRAVNTDLAAGVEPLAHFLSTGLSEGRAPRHDDPPPSAGEAVDRAAITALKPLADIGGGREVALVVAEATDGGLPPAETRLVEALSGAGVAVALVVAAEGPISAIAVDPATLAGLYVREGGGAFAAWAHLLQLRLDLFDAALLLLVDARSESLKPAPSVAEMLRQVRAARGDVVALAEHREPAWRLDARWLALKPRALANPGLLAFWLGLRQLDDAAAMQADAEMRLTAEAIRAGLVCETLISGGQVREAPTIDGDDPPNASMAPARRTSTRPEPVEDAGAGAAPRRIALFGPWNYDYGQGVAGRGYVSALWRLGAEVKLSPITGPISIHARRIEAIEAPDFAGPADIAIVHLNPDAWDLLSDDQRIEVARAKLRIGCWVWEMDRFPNRFRAGFGAVDAVWAPSRYCAELLGRETDLPVHVVPHVVATPAEARPTTPEMRTVLGLPPDRRVILYVFDGASSLARKNPAALIDAFDRSMLTNDGWALVLKAKNLELARDHGALTALAEATPGVGLLNHEMSGSDVADLIAAADIYASPHASEGFGQTIAEAMAAGKTVVATDHGGSRDFLDATCGYPVAWREVRLAADDGPYPADGGWAQVDVTALAEALRAAAGRVVRGDHSLGERARARIAARFSADAVAQAMRDSLDRLAAHPVARTAPWA